MKIEVNEYVRTKRGIAKVLEVKIVQTKMYGKHDTAYLIDLIEVGDIVVILDTKFNTKDYIFIDDNRMLEAVKTDLTDRCKLLEILTHEQMEANAYKIEQT